MKKYLLTGLLLFVNGCIFASTANLAPFHSGKDFQARYWVKPVPPQGTAPKSFNKLTASLRPKDCGACHASQYKQWKTTVHSHSMGPGLLVQIIKNKDPSFNVMCQSCHTPLSEQNKDLPSSSSLTGFINNPDFSAKLRNKGLVCAACHVRKNLRYGPPSAGVDAEKMQNSRLPHAGFISTKYFTKSVFCKTCHQFDPSDPKLNGKLIEDTYNEWKTSKYAKQDIQCQTCHMPDRQHLWRGIHDPAMTCKAITIKLSKYNKKQHSINITIKNTGAGHLFPTYLTPKVYVRWQQVDARGRKIVKTYQENTIGWMATIDLSNELYDTRIPPGKQITFTYNKVLASNAAGLQVKIVVFPESFYARFYESMMQTLNHKTKAYRMYKEALYDAHRGIFTIYKKTVMF